MVVRGPSPIWARNSNRSSGSKTHSDECSHEYGEYRHRQPLRFSLKAYLQFSLDRAPDDNYKAFGAVEVAKNEVQYLYPSKGIPS